jgi:hypothetical protein
LNPELTVKIPSTGFRVFQKICFVDQKDHGNPRRLSRHPKSIDDARRKFRILRGRHDHHLIDVRRNHVHDDAVASRSEPTQLIAPFSDPFDHAVLPTEHLHFYSIADADRRALAQFR